MNDDERGRGIREMLALSDLMLEIRLQRLRDQHPDLPEQEVVRLFNKELADRPMDGEGVVGQWLRQPRA